eukprot:2733781-Rhodomonas_salina.1
MKRAGEGACRRREGGRKSAGEHEEKEKERKQGGRRRRESTAEEKRKRRRRGARRGRRGGGSWRRRRGRRRGGGRRKGRRCGRGGRRRLDSSAWICAMSLLSPRRAGAQALLQFPLVVASHQGWTALALARRRRVSGRVESDAAGLGWAGAGRDAGAGAPALAHLQVRSDRHVHWRPVSCSPRHLAQSVVRSATARRTLTATLTA